MSAGRLKIREGCKAIYRVDGWVEEGMLGKKVGMIFYGYSLGIKFHFYADIYIRCMGRL